MRTMSMGVLPRKKPATSCHCQNQADSRAEPNKLSVCALAPEITRPAREMGLHAVFCKTRSHLLSLSNVQLCSRSGY